MAEDVGAASRSFSYRFVTFNDKSEYVCRIIRIFAPMESSSVSTGVTTIRHTSTSPKVNEWMDLHEAEILTLWEKAQKGEKLGRIEPLK